MTASTPLSSTTGAPIVSPPAVSPARAPLSTSKARDPRPRGSLRPDTLLLHAVPGDDPRTGALSTPIFQATTFGQDELGGTPEWCYARTGNPTRAVLEQALAALEGADHAFAFASGLAAANALLQSELRAGDHVIAAQDLYGGCYRLFTKVFSKLGIAFSLVDTTSLDAIAASIRRTTRLLWLETPSNPLLKVTDVAACAALVRGTGVRVVADNTFASPVLQQPLALGADIVLHSTTKSIGGHCDVLGGALVTSDPELAQRLRFVQNATGAVPAPFDCFLLLRGLRTLSLRVRRQSDSAAILARWLEADPRVARVYYPGLPSHPGHEIAARQSEGFGSIVSFEPVAGGAGRTTARDLVRGLELFTLAESLGGVRSLVCHPATMTHAAVEPAERTRIGIGEGLLRLSVGIEHPADLVDDLDAALAAAIGTSETTAVAEVRR